MRDNKPKKSNKGPKVKRTRFNSEREDKESSAGTRLNKCIANAGVCSRREADKLIASGVVKVNGEVITEMGFKVQDGDEVRCNGKLLKKQRFKYLLLNKPKDYITTVTDTHDRKTVMDLVGKACAERIYPVGRLDRNTTGVLLFTNDGDLTKRLTHPSFNVKKVYQVQLDQGIEEDDLKKLIEGVELEDGIAKFDEAYYTERGNMKEVTVELHSGKNRIVRRMFEFVGTEVVKLDRIEFAGMKKGKVTRGKWRFLEPKEVGFLKMT